ncbi:MAG: tetratricopeptide repeat protein [Flavobacteriales bacterium]|nr:tetratricopeptide repeat protein [Flavobacteriales bacterium]MBP9080177.1 tetratricopeptide repeat protein [Flavobacteriales bacterium]
MHRGNRSKHPLGRILVGVSMVGAGLGAWAQNPVQSPAGALALKDDTAKVMALSDLCYGYRRKDPDSAAFFGQSALHLARRLGYPRGEAQACNDLAILHIDRSEYTRADSLLVRALNLRKQLQDSAGMAAVHNKRGIVFQARSMFEQALEEDHKALAIYERTGPPAHEATLLNNIAILQFNLQRLPEALATHRRAAAIRERIGDGAGLAASHGNMANVEVQLGDTSAAAGHYQAAIRYFREQGLQPELAVQVHNLAGIEMARGQLAQAAAHYGEALAIRTGTGDRKGTASSLIGLGGTRVRQGRTSEAAQLLHKGLDLSREVQARSEEMQALLDLARLHAGMDHGDSSFLFHQRYAALKDSIFNAEMGARLAEAETRFKTQEKENRIQTQRAAIAELEAGNKKRELWIALTLGACVLLVMAVLLLVQVRLRRSRAKHDAAIIGEREAGLRGILLATEEERKRIARELHDGVGQMITGLKFRLEEIAVQVNAERPPPHRAVAEALAITTDAGRETRNLAHALMPRSLEAMGLVAATGDMLERALGPAGITHQMDHFGLDRRLPAELETGLFRIAQELVQNTMKHAQADQVNLQLLKNNGHLVLIYEDDGKGLQDLGQRATGGIGLGNIRERVRALRGHFTMANGDHKGMVATVRIPLDEAAA